MDKQQRVFLLDKNTPEYSDVVMRLDSYLKEGWIIVQTAATNETYLLVLEKDFTLK